jgi:predicted XRE-type DNA-binding protein
MYVYHSVFMKLSFVNRAAELKELDAAARVLERIIQRRDLTQPQAAKLLGVSQPRINDLLRGRLHRFSVDALLAMMDKADIRVEFKVKLPKAA